jgi:hypothetical protein
MRPGWVTCGPGQAGLGFAFFFLCVERARARPLRSERKDTSSGDRAVCACSRAPHTHTTTLSLFSTAHRARRFTPAGAVHLAGVHGLHYGEKGPKKEGKSRTMPACGARLASPPPLLARRGRGGGCGPLLPTTAVASTSGRPAAVAARVSVCGSWAWGEGRVFGAAAANRRPSVFRAAHECVEEARVFP